MPSKKPPIRPRKRSHLEAGFLRLWDALARGRPMPEREFRFAPPRLFRLDFAWPSVRLGVEIEGGIFVRGRHGRPMGITQDCEKYNLAAEAGWRVLRYTTLDLKKRPAQVIEQVLRLLDQAPAVVHQTVLDLEERF